MYESTAQAEMNDTALRITSTPPSPIDLPVSDFVISPIAAEYVPIVYTEPLEENLDSILFNIASNPSCNATINAARATSQTLAAPPLRMLRNGVATTEVVVMRPFDSIQPGREGSQGIIIGAIRLGTFLEKQFKRGGHGRGTGSGDGSGGGGGDGTGGEGNLGRDLHPSTFQFNLSRFCNKNTPSSPPNTP